MGAASPSALFVRSIEAVLQFSAPLQPQPEQQEERQEEEQEEEQEEVNLLLRHWRQCSGRRFRFREFCSQALEHRDLLDRVRVCLYESKCRSIWKPLALFLLQHSHSLDSEAARFLFELCRIDPNTKGLFHIISIRIANSIFPTKIGRNFIEYQFSAFLSNKSSHHIAKHDRVSKPPGWLVDIASVYQSTLDPSLISKHVEASLRTGTMHFGAFSALCVISSPKSLLNRISEFLPSKPPQTLSCVCAAVDSLQNSLNIVLKESLDIGDQRNLCSVLRAYQCLSHAHEQEKGSSHPIRFSYSFFLQDRFSPAKCAERVLHLLVESMSELLKTDHKSDIRTQIAFFKRYRRLSRHLDGPYVASATRRIDEQCNAVSDRAPSAPATDSFSSCLDELRKKLFDTDAANLTRLLSRLPSLFQGAGRDLAANVEKLLMTFMKCLLESASRGSAASLADSCRWISPFCSAISKCDNKVTETLSVRLKALVHEHGPSLDRCQSTGIAVLFSVLLKDVASSRLSSKASEILENFPLNDPAKLRFFCLFAIDFFSAVNALSVGFNIIGQGPSPPGFARIPLRFAQTIMYLVSRHDFFHPEELSCPVTELSACAHLRRLGEITSPVHKCSFATPVENDLPAVLRRLPPLSMEHLLRLELSCVTSLAALCPLSVSAEAFLAHQLRPPHRLDKEFVDVLLREELSAFSPASSPRNLRLLTSLQHELGSCSLNASWLFDLCSASKPSLSALLCLLALLPVDGFTVDAVLYHLEECCRRDLGALSTLPLHDSVALCRHLIRVERELHLQQALSCSPLLCCLAVTSMHGNGIEGRLAGMFEDLLRALDCIRSKQDSDSVEVLHLRSLCCQSPVLLALITLHWHCRYESFDVRSSSFLSKTVDSALAPFCACLLFAACRVAAAARCAAERSTPFLLASTLIRVCGVWILQALISPSRPEPIGAALFSLEQCLSHSNENLVDIRCRCAQVLLRLALQQPLSSLKGADLQDVADALLRQYEHAHVQPLDCGQPQDAVEGVGQALQWDAIRDTRPLLENLFSTLNCSDTLSRRLLALEQNQTAPTSQSSSRYVLQYLPELQELLANSTTKHEMKLQRSRKRQRISSQNSQT